MAAADEPVRKSTGREYYEALLIAIIFVNFARIFVFQAFKIPSGSMEDNLKIGDHIIVNKFIYGRSGDGALSKLIPTRDVRRGDVIVFRFPEDPETDFVKRVVGLPGETIEIRDKQVHINGKALEEPYAVFDDSTIYPAQPALPEPYRSRDQFGPVTVPAGQYFSMGDNRDHSHDSRYWGFVPRPLLKGRAFMVYWSFDGPPPPAGASGTARVRHLAKVVGRFFQDTRWKRTFFVVDRHDHYTPGISTYGNN
jgi:signal peptidase I